MIPTPFSCNPGDRLQVIRDKPCGTDLRPGDLVTVLDTGIHVSNGIHLPVVQVSTSHGPQFLTFDAVMPHTDADLPAIKAAEPDDVVDAFFWRILGNDDELRDWAVTARSELAKNDPTETEAPSGTTAVAERLEGDAVGRPYTWTDPDGDTLEVIYFEQDCDHHGRHGGFHISINEEEEVVIPAAMIDGLVRFLLMMKKHGERPPGV